MSSLNRATLIGNVGKDPEIRTTQSGKRVANFTLATSESWKDRNTGEKKERTEWHRISVFNDGLVGVIEQYVTKGDKLMVEGQIQTRKWTDQSGQDRWTTEIVLSGFGGKLLMLGSRSSGDRTPDRQQDYNAPPEGGPDDDLDSEIPF